LGCYSKFNAIRTSQLTSNVTVHFFMPGLLRSPLAVSTPTPVSRWREIAYQALDDSREFTIRTFVSASSIPPDVWECFKTFPQNSNILYPHALKRRAAERNGQASIGTEFWMVYWSNQPFPTIDLVLSCTDGPLGTYPIIIFTPHEPERLYEAFIRPRITRLIYALDQQVLRHRVYSVFAPEEITKVFAKVWSAHTGIAIEKEPYYAALITYCTRATFRNRRTTIDPDFVYDLRLAEETDIPAAAELCYGFAETSVCTFLQMHSTEELTPHSGTIYIISRTCC
jgi:hypothetical protein